MHIRRPEEIAAAAHEARRRLGLSQTEFAARLEVNREWVSRLENGEPGVAQRVILVLGRWYNKNGVGELHRAFRWIFDER